MVKMQNRYTQALYLSTGYGDFGRRTDRVRGSGWGYIGQKGFVW